MVCKDIETGHGERNLSYVSLLHCCDIFVFSIIMFLMELEIP